MIKTKLYTFLFLLVAITVFGQQKQVETSIDSTKIRIGSQFHLILKAKVDTAARVNFPEGKNFGQLEVLESYKVDTVKKGAMYELVKKYGLTQFDSGRYVIPRLPVVINNKTIQTDSFLVEVANIKVDTLKQKMYDIKDVMGNESKSLLWLYILLGILGLAGIGFGIYWYIKKRKKQPKAVAPVYATPIEKATALLQSLEKEELLQKGEVKDYYSKLTDIARIYIEEAIHVPAMESTTTELIEAMRVAVQRKKMRLNQETFEQLEKVLRTADLVKFAKSRPMDFEIAEDRSRIEKTIVTIDKSIPEEKEEDEQHTQQWLEMQEKKKKQRKKKIIIISSAAVIVIVLGLFITIKGVEYAKDTILGNTTKELLEGEWIKSEYGNPGVVIETPKVLKRENMQDELPKDAMALIKDMQAFAYGSMIGDFYVYVATNAYKQQVEIDLTKAFDGAAVLWEKSGAQNIIVKQETFSTAEGTEGLRAYGTMSVPGSTGMEKAYYEVLYFKQGGGLQQIMIIHRDGDKSASEMLERIKKSVEFKQAI